MFEVLRGLFLKKMPSEKINEARKIIGDFRVLQLDDASTIKAASISSELVKKGQIISDCDCLIAGIALTNGLNKIVTNNTKHFQRINELKVITY